MRNFASTYHDYIVKAMDNYKGQDLRTGEILKILINKFPELEIREDWIQPPDHCIWNTRWGSGLVSCIRQQEKGKRERFCFLVSKLEVKNK